MPPPRIRMTYYKELRQKWRNSFKGLIGIFFRMLFHELIIRLLFVGVQCKACLAPLKCLMGSKSCFHVTVKEFILFVPVYVLQQM